MAVATVAAAAPAREYAPGFRSFAVYRPREVRIEGVGLMNEREAFVATSHGVSLLQDGHLAPAFEVSGGSRITAAHLCHHRSSILYETLSEDHGTLTISEYSLTFREKLDVAELQDAEPATSIACVDELLLRSSPDNMMAVGLHTKTVTVLREFARDGSDAIASLAVGFAADLFTRAEIYAVVPQNRSVLQLRLTAGNGTGVPTLRGGPFLHGGDGSDGPLSLASLRDPRHVSWSHDALVVADGCALRRVAGGEVRTVLGSPEACVRSANETLEPVPWATRLARPRALAGAADGTAVGTVLMLSGLGVVSIEEGDGSCTEHAEEAACASAGCGWAEGLLDNETLCLACPDLTAWAADQRPQVAVCDLELARRVDTRYSLAGCGCLPPPTTTPAAATADDSVGHVFRNFMAGLLVVAAGLTALLLHRASKRAAAMRELYGADEAEFYVFNDEDCA